MKYKDKIRKKQIFDERLEPYIRRALSKGKSITEITNSLILKGYKRAFVNTEIREYFVKDVLIKPIFLITLLLIIPSLLYYKLPVLGRGYQFQQAEGNIQNSFNYTDEIKLSLAGNYSYNWDLMNKGELTSLGISGTISKSGSAKVYLRHEEENYLIFDSSKVSKTDLKPSTTSVYDSHIKEKESNNESDKIKQGKNRTIVLKLNYKDNTEYDVENDGIEPVGKIIDFTVERSLFDWDVNYSNLCTKWEVYNQENSTFVCYGDVKCCGFIDLAPSSGNWDDSFNIDYGKYNSGLNNTVSAQIIYVDYSLDILNPYQNIYYSNLESLNAIFQEEFYSFEDICIETCTLPNLDYNNYNLIFEVDNATLNVDSISYNITQARTETNLSKKNITIINESTEHSEVVINRPVKWVKKIKLNDNAPNLTVQIPRNVGNISVSKIEKEKKKELKNVSIEIDNEIADIETYNLVTGSAFRTDINKLTDKGWMQKILAWLNNIVKTGLAGLIPKEEQNSTLIIQEQVKEVEIEYYTEGPKSIEEEINSSVKRVVISSEIHYENVLAYSHLDKEVKIYDVHLYWIVNDTRQSIWCEKYDTNGNGLIDYIEWTVPSLSNQTYEIVIEIIKAQLLDENRSVIAADIFDYLKRKDDIWFKPNSSHYIRVTFEKELTNENDISIYAKSNSSAEVEVYTRDNNTLIAKFEPILDEDWYKVYLTNLSGSYDTFDLKVIGDVEFDYIVDPTIIIRDVSIDAALVNITAERNFTHLEISNNPPYNKLQLYMPFDVNTTNVTDYTLNHNDGELKNGAQYSVGKYGSGVKFDGIDDFINITDSSSLELGKMSIAFWFKPDVDYLGGSGDITFVYHKDYSVYIDNDANIVFDYKGSIINFSSNWLKDTWYHVVATYDGNSKVLYIDGKNETTIIVSPAFIVQNSTGGTVALFSEKGDLTLKGGCYPAADCVYPGDDTFVIQNPSGDVVAYIDRNGELCIEDSNCNDNDANCDYPGDGAFIVQDENGHTVSYINAGGQLCLIGGLVEYGNP